MRTPFLPLIGLALLLAIGLVHCTAAWAQIPIPLPRPKQGKYLPPAEFDRPYPGALEIFTVPTGERVRESCPEVNFTIEPLACNIRWGMVKCHIFMVPDAAIRAAGYDPEVVRRHEVGHCNGWPGHHPGAR